MSFLRKNLDGDAGYRSPYLSHAKRALYHLSYIPFLSTETTKTVLLRLEQRFTKYLTPPHAPPSFQGHLMRLYSVLQS